MGESYCSLRVSRSAVSFGAVIPIPGGGRPGTRGSVQRFSDKSKARLVRYLADCRADYIFFGTLTVGHEYSLDGEVFKRAVDRFLSWFLRRERAQSSSPDQASICWFLEFQKRGAPHLHFFYTDFVPFREAAPKWVESLELSGASSTDGVAEAGTRFELLRAGRSGTISYARKYAVKQSQKEVPEGYQNVGRYWGVRGLSTVDSVHEELEFELGGREVLIELYKEMVKLSKHSDARVFKWQERVGYVVAPRNLASPGGAWTTFVANVHRLLASWYVNDGWVGFYERDPRKASERASAEAAELPHSRLAAAPPGDAGRL